MIEVSILEADDVIEATDLVRQLDHLIEGQSDYIQFTSAYSGRPINRMRWQTTQDFCPAWVGKKVGVFIKAMNMRSDHGYEFVRGPAPKSHMVEEE